MKKIKAGYLPFYIKLYDDGNPQKREPMVALSGSTISVNA